MGHSKQYRKKQSMNIKFLNIDGIIITNNLLQRPLITTLPQERRILKLQIETLIYKIKIPQILQLFTQPHRM
jgi:hypothetical protein